MERYRMTFRPIRRGLIGAALTVLASGGAIAQSSSETGIPACDAFYRAYEACITQRLPEAQRSIFRQTLERNRAEVREQAADPEDRASAERTCQEQKQQSARFFAPYGCTFN
jgi:phage-related minor tail protein